MVKVKLDSRLSAVASLIREGVTVADIGTDHAYLLAYMLQNNLITKGIAADLRQGPLDNARRTLVECGELEKVRLVLSDGLDEIKKGDCEDVVLAGMGGILIKEILERTDWIFDESIHIVAQPMTHAEVLRRFYAENGFKILKEAAATDGKRCYCVISAQYDGVKRSFDNWYYYIGELVKNTDENSLIYINKIITALSKKLAAIKAAGVEDTEDLEKTLGDINTKLSEVKNG